MKKNTIVLTIFSIIHFIVDFSCIYFMYNLFIDKNINQSTIITMVIIYNFFAFFMQAPFGIMIDYFKGSYKYGALGCLLIILSTLFYKYKLISVMILGIGNALFHLSGGVEILNRSEGKSSMPGVFVSTGAIGLFLGGQIKNIFNINDYFKYCIFLILIISTILLLITDNKIGIYKQQLNNKIENNINNYKKIIIFLIIIFVVCIVIRSFVGTFSNFTWKKIFIYNLFLTFCVAFGKFIGGFLSDRFSAKNITFISLLLSSILFIFSEKYYVAGMISIFLFNMTMPITLTYIANLLNNNKGFAFGLTTLGLFFGYLPHYCSMFANVNIINFIPYIIILQNLLLCICIHIEDKIINNK